MFPTLALAAALSLAPAQNGALTISNDRLTFGGALGPTRPDNKYQPGDLFLLAFDIENLTVDKEGKVGYQIAMEITDAKGKSVYSTKDGQGAYLPLGGTKLPSSAFAPLAPEYYPPGTYTCRISIVDQATKAAKELTKKFDVVPAAFGIVNLVASNDQQALLHSPFGGYVGQLLWLNFNVVQFARDDKTKEPDVSVELRVLEGGSPVTKQPQALHYTRLTRGVTEIANQMVVPFNRAGKFTVEIKAECNVTKKTSTVTIPLTVTPAPR
jgi:hypothetical protein